MSALIRWLRSSVRGEVSTAELTTRRRAGGEAYALLQEAGETTGDDRGARLFRLCAWNAFALQSIVDTMLDADDREDPGTAGYVPRSTLEFVGACLNLVPTWIRAARIVQSDPTAAIAVPAFLPKWRMEESTTRLELRGLRAAYEALQPRIASDLDAFDGDDDVVRSLRRLFAEMTSAADYAAALDHPRAGAVDRGEVRWRLLDALATALLLGQLLAVPTLAEVTPAPQLSVDQPAIASEPTWVQIESGWPVFDRDGVLVGRVERAHGDHSTGELQTVDVDPGLGHATLCVPASCVGRISNGVVDLAVARDELHAG